jgi:hypothetical protein
MPEEKPPTEPPTSSSPERAPIPPRARFGPNDPPNTHISRDPSLVLQAASGEIPGTATTVAPAEVSETAAPMSEGPVVQPVQTVQEGVKVATVWSDDHSGHQVAIDAARQRRAAAVPPIASSLQPAEGRATLETAPYPTGLGSVQPYRHTAY